MVSVTHDAESRFHTAWFRLDQPAEGLVAHVHGLADAEYRHSEGVETTLPALPSLYRVATRNLEPAGIAHRWLGTT